MLKAKLRSLFKLETDAAPVSVAEVDQIEEKRINQELNASEEVAVISSNQHIQHSSTDLSHSSSRQDVDQLHKNQVLAVSNTQGQVVMQFSNVNGLHIGSVYNINGNGANNVTTESGKIKRTRTIDQMMKSSEAIDHRTLDTIATHLGKGWRTIMRELEFSDGQIDQAMIDHQIHGGIKEVVYQLLLDWKRNADEEKCTLGYISRLLWKFGHRDCIFKLKEVWKSRQ